ncbi:MBL fold metallo-hydrolase [Planctomycetales bacterium ZRK34]|nr:MBL fold metallo-hydrolase [Planctomycetales bacterium ZRK34]
MSLIMTTVNTEGISELSYILGDSNAGRVAVVDPRPDCEIYLRLAREHGAAITDIFETHNHADFMSGSLELAARCGGATIHLSEIGGTTYDFDHEPIRDGQAFDFGSVTLTARHTPGHTPEHVSFLVAMSDTADDPWAVLSGDCLFVGSAGRPDLIHGEGAEDLPDQLHRSLYDFYLKLDDAVIVLPCHGAGSACGANIGDRPLSTIGYERRHNPFLQFDDVDKFKQFVRNAPPEPNHYSRMKKLNMAGPPLLQETEPPRAMTPEQFESACSNSTVQLLDTRGMLAFGGGHIPGSLNIGNSPQLSVWAGWLLDPDKPLLLVTDDDAEVPRVLRRLHRVGLTKVAGYLAGGIKAWITRGRRLEHVDQISVTELRDRCNQDDALQLLDVRKDSEWESGHIPGAVHYPLPQLCAAPPDELDAERPVAVYCGSGYRASIGASLLKRHGFERVCNVPGSFSAWQSADYTIAADQHA